DPAPALQACRHVHPRALGVADVLDGDGLVALAVDLLAVQRDGVEPDPAVVVDHRGRLAPDLLDGEAVGRGRGGVGCVHDDSSVVWCVLVCLSVSGPRPGCKPGPGGVRWWSGDARGPRLVVGDDL